MAQECDLCKRYGSEFDSHSGGGNESVLMEMGCPTLNPLFPSAYPGMCGIQREPKII